MNLKKIRLEKNLSVPDLVEISEVPRRTIQNIELNGDCRISTAAKLAYALNISLDELYGFDKTKSP
ncbi:MAG: helix-turn-helix domain-containing protein [Defluviitaleaceae bacterium]|nr:helix-turn-helix domain-containing protein [Defluviitaleaceae bacterium]